MVDIFVLKGYNKHIQDKYRLKKKRRGYHWAKIFFTKAL